MPESTERMLTVEKRRGATVVKVGLRRLFLDSAQAFREELLEVAKTADSSVVVDLGAVNVMNSSALGALILASDILRKRGHDLILTNPGPVLRQVLSRMKLDTILTIVSSLEEAFALVSGQYPVHS